MTAAMRANTTRVHVLDEEQVGGPFDVGDYPSALGNGVREVGELAVQAGRSAQWRGLRGQPLPMATPMSASFSARASFTPSPVIATTCPRNCSAPTIALFCCGVTRPKALCSFEYASEFVQIGWQRPCVDRVLGTAYARNAEGCCAPRRRFVGCRPEMTLRRHSLGGEERQRFGGVGDEYVRRESPARPAPGLSAAGRRHSSVDVSV